MTTENAGLPVARDADTVKYFTVASANRTLVLVERIVRDIVHAYAELMRMRTTRDDLSVDGAADSHELAELEAVMVAKADALNALEQELRDIGCQLKDWSVGLVDFPAALENRTVLLCWKLGEDRVSHWHELHTGFSGRRPIGPEFDE